MYHLYYIFVFPIFKSIVFFFTLNYYITLIVLCLVLQFEVLLVLGRLVQKVYTEPGNFTCIIWENCSHFVQSWIMR